MSRMSSPRGEHAPKPGATWETDLTTLEVVVPDDDTVLPQPNRATRRALTRRRRKNRPTNPEN